MSARAASLAFALCTAALCASLVWQELPLGVDYPQHLAMARQLRDLVLGVGQGQLVPWTYNGLFEVAAGLMALVVPIGLSGRIVLAASVALTSLAVWRLARFCGRPPVNAFAWLPLAYSFPLSWGFVNFTLSVALATLSLLCWFERRSAWVFVVLSLLAGVAHVLGAVVIAGGVLLGSVLRVRDVHALLQLCPVLVWVAGAHAAADPPPHLWWANQTFYPKWPQRFQLADTLLGSWQGSADEWLAGAIACVAAIGVTSGAIRALRRRQFVSRQPFHWLALVALVLYVFAPLAVFGCWYFYHRAGYLLTVWVPALLPEISLRRWKAGQAAVIVAAGSLSTVNFLMHNRLGVEASQAQAIIAAVPAGAKVAPVLSLAANEKVEEALLPSTGSEALVWAHFPAYAVALRDAEITWMFAREHPHFPVRLPVGPELGLPQVDYGWGQEFDPLADYAREFNYVLVLVGRREPTRDPKASVFGEAAAGVTNVAHEGRFWLFEYIGASP